MLCKIYRKATSLKVLEQRAEMEAKMNNQTTPNSPLSSSETISSVGKEEDLMMTTTSFPFPQAVVAMKEANEISMLQEQTENAKKEEKQRETERKEASSSLKRPCGISPLPELQVPKPGLEWGSDQWPSISPWLQNLTPIINLLNF